MKKKMKKESLDTYQHCDTAIEPATLLYEKVPAVVKKLIKLLKDKDSFSHVEPIPIPSNESVMQLIRQARRILFPGYFTQSTLSQANLEYYLGQETTTFLENLSRQIISAFQHDCFRLNLPCTKCSDQGHDIALKIVQELPAIKNFWIPTSGLPMKVTRQPRAMTRSFSATRDFWQSPFTGWPICFTSIKSLSFHES